MRGDQRVLVQVLNNLLSNAIKFTPQGGRIAVRAWAAAARSILLSVADHGIGMTEEGLATALRPFHQAPNSRPRAHQGTDLGPHLCANFLRPFAATLPTTTPPGARPPAPKTTPPAPPR